MPRFTVKTGLASALAFGMLLFLSPSEAQNLRGAQGRPDRKLSGEDKAASTAPEEDKGLITNALVGGAAAWATGGNVWHGAVGGAIGGAMTDSPMGAAAGGYLGGSKEEVAEGDKAASAGLLNMHKAVEVSGAEDKAATIVLTPDADKEDKGMITNALVGGAAAWATGGSVMQGAAGGVIGGYLTGSPVGAAAGGYLGGSKEVEVAEGDKAASAGLLVNMHAAGDKAASAGLLNMHAAGSKEEVPVEDKAMTVEPEDDKGMITNALVGGAAAWATGGSVMQGAAGGVIGGAMTGTPMGAAAGGYLGGSKDEVPAGEKP
jgi:hypothetical protein